MTLCWRSFVSLTSVGHTGTAKTPIYQTHTVIPLSIVILYDPYFDTKQTERNENNSK